MIRARTLYQSGPLPKGDQGLLIASLEEQLQQISSSLFGVDRDKATLVSAPATASAPGTPGMVAYDSDYIYVCVTTDTWKRAALSTW